jgi:S-DNA-T family DNA segregation ATPase FtsK/SpoIIIE
MAKKQKKTKTAKSAPSVWATPEVRGFLTLTFACALFLSLMSFAVQPDAKNMLGLMGHTLGWTSYALLGLGSYPLAFYLGWIGWRRLFNKPLNHLLLKSIYVGVAITSLCTLLSLVECHLTQFTDLLRQLFYPALWAKKQRYHLGGAPFHYLYCDLPFYNLHHLFNTIGVALIFSSTLVASLLFLFKIQLSVVLQNMLQRLKSEKEALKATEEEAPLPVVEVMPKEEDSDFLRFVKLRIPTSLNQDASSSNKNMSPDLLAIHPEKNPTVRPSLSRKEKADEEDEWTDHAALKKRIEPFDLKAPSKKLSLEAPKEIEKIDKRKTALIAQSIHNGDFTNFKLPPIQSLANPKKTVDQSSLKKDLKRQAEVLEETLLSFGIEAKVGQINCGPTITSFEVHPAIGVKVQRIKALDNDIALNMEAKSIRIIAPIPGKAAVGIEVPNSQPQEVGFKDMLLAYQQGGVKFNIPILLGKAVNGDYVMSDLSKMPHCIIAGATGSGKSVCINTIIMSILFNAKPDQIKLIMVDPKKVELTPYSRLPHMLAPVITEPQGAAAALNWLVKEMESRYETLKLVGARNIESFNKRTINKEAEESLEREIPTFMPFIVGIIDELADLMMVASQDIETPIARIAQMARAVGIHLILATQRPSREVITGLIKANFPTRVAFKVASRVNSQIILDETGAESLLGNGDMLFLPPGSSHLIRAQGAFIRDEDIQATVQHICEQAPPNYIIQSFDHMMGIEGSAKGEEMQFDSLYEQAKEVVLSTGNASTTFLQRKLKVGYARAASLMDQLESQGIVGPADGSKPRKIYGKKGAESEELALDF